jgi:hypothetical protein
MKFKSYTTSLMKKHPIKKDTNDQEIDNFKRSIEKSYNDLEKKLLDPDYFNCLIGKKRLSIHTNH